METHLLVFKDSFEWADFLADKSQQLEDLILAYDKITESEANIYTYGLFEIVVQNKPFYEWIYGDWEDIVQLSPWVTDKYQSVLIDLWQRASSPQNATNIHDLENEFPKQCNGTLGLPLPSSLPKHVYNETSWENLLIDYLQIHNDQIDWSNHAYFPNLKYSNELYKVMKEKKGGYEEMADSIASANFYFHNQALSSDEGRLRGSQRRIYEVNKQGQKQYLSLDFEKKNGGDVCFEVCNADGKHLGEYKFNGELNSQQDSSGNHDIWVIAGKPKGKK